MIYQRKAGRRVAVVGCIVLLAACAERGGKVVGPDAPRSTRVQTDLSWLSRSIAVGMGEPEVRAAVRDAMRASRLTEHKLSLQQFMTTAEGSLLLRAAAAVQETSAQELSEAIARLPELDFYVPRREHRLTWRASRDYMVVATMNADPRKTGFDADGRSVVLDISLPETPGPAVLLLHPAETKSRRVAPQPDRAGLTIQDPDDGELSGTFVFTDAEGRITVVELADLLLHAQPFRPMLDHCDPTAINCEHTTDTGGGPPPDSTYLTYIETHGICDWADCGQGNEFEFFAQSWDGSTGHLRIENIPSTTAQLRFDLVITSEPLDDQSVIQISVKETDGVWGDDQFYLAEVGYCGPIPLGASFNGAAWWLTEQSCDAFVNKTLGVKFQW